MRGPYEKRDPLVQKHLDIAANGPKAQQKKLLKELDRAKSKKEQLNRPTSNRRKDFGFDLWKSGDGSGIAKLLLLNPRLLPYGVPQAWSTFILHAHLFNKR